jgi:hypothetical protein
LQFSPNHGNQVKEDVTGGAQGMHRTDEKYKKILIGKPEGKTSLGALGNRWENILRWSLQKYM